MTSTAEKPIPQLAGDFAEVVIYAATPESRKTARRIADAIAQTPDGNGINISIRSGMAPPAPGTYSK